MHEGHRQRMLDKLENGDNLFDHEVLEILLYNAYPRKNTNPLAHLLLERFGTLHEILNADVKELKSVKGIGDAVANYLKVVGECLKRAGLTEGIAVLNNMGDCKKLVSMRMRGKREEFLDFYYLEKSGKVKRTVSYTSSDRNKVVADARLILNDIALIKPHGLLVAHNHLNNSSAPSVSDEAFTGQVQLICSMNGVVFYDHIIYAGENNIYSFKDAGALEEISRKFSVNNLIKWTMNSN